MAGVGEADYINRQLMEILAPKKDYMAVREGLMGNGNGLSALATVCAARMPHLALPVTWLDLQMTEAANVPGCC